MRIALHNASRILGGAEIGEISLAAGLARRGHSVKMFCSHGIVADAARARGVEVETCYLGGDVMLHHAGRLARALKKHSAEALILGSYNKLFLAALAGRMAGVRQNVAMIQISRDMPRNWKYRFVLKRWIDHTILVSDDLRSDFLQMAPEIDPASLVAIPNPCDFRGQGESSGGLRRDLGIPDDAQVIGSMGRLTRQKRFDRLIEALSRLPARVHCIVAGEGAERSGLEGLALQLGVRDRVHLIGWREDIGEVLGALDVYVVSSDYEGLSIAMTEALAVGVPVVSTPTSGSGEIFKTDRDDVPPGALVDFDADEIATAIHRLLEDPRRHDAARRAARRIAAEHFALDVVLERWETVLGAAAGRTRP
jgi:glycosyltransferase involved in cell wall biosynthesis